MAGLLLLIPVPLAGLIKTDCEPVLASLSSEALNALTSCRYLIAENAKTARRLLKACGVAPASVQIETITPSPTASDLSRWLAPAVAGEAVGLVSEAGCPAVADPGSEVVAAAHRLGIAVRPLAGPSALLLALMASGLGGQRFRCHGYLPSERSARRAAIVRLDADARRNDESQIVIETPYRNWALARDLVEVCAAESRLCLASGIGSASEWINSRRISDWRSDWQGETPPADWPHSEPTVFIVAGRERGSPCRPGGGQARR